MNNSISLTFLFIAFITFSLQGQDYDWNKNYPETNINELLKYENLYADSVDNGLISGEMYNRMDFCRFYGIYTGEKREISEVTKKEMKWVYKNHGNKDYAYLIDELKIEYKFNINGEILWLSIQNELNRAFKKEVKKNMEILLYCLFLNNHPKKNSLANYFLISEFSTDIAKNQGNENWIQLENNLTSKLTKIECDELFQSKKIRYVQTTGDTIIVKLENNIWSETQDKGKYHNKGKFILKGDCEYELEFIESNNPEEKKQFRKGDKILYRVIEKKGNYFLMTAEKDGVVLQFRLYYQ